MVKLKLQNNNDIPSGITAVDWLVNEVRKKRSITNSDIAKANEIFQKQIISAYQSGDDNGSNYNCTFDSEELVTPEEYYLKTYKQQ